MISIEEALNFVLSRAEQTAAVRRPVLECVARVLAEDVASDIDSPPHDKAMMDGYALHESDLAAPTAELTVIEEVNAGDVPAKTLTPGHATRIMTGAPVPEGAAGVIMIERTELMDKGDAPAKVKILDTSLPQGRNIMPRATSLAKGDVILRRGTTIRPIEVGVLSEVGRTKVEAYERPRVAVMTSGNELVTPDVLPGAGQIRNSNNPMLVALARRAAGDASDLGIARDEEPAIRRLVDEGLKHDILILSGGVSAGVADLVPKVLADVGVEQVFHKVNLKPGKPLWFGVHPAENRSTLVFGLPGNPVSSLVCFELFVRPAMQRMTGRAAGEQLWLTARLTTTHQQRGDRETYFPGVLNAISKGEQAAHATPTDGLPAVQPLPWQGSADLATLAQANCLIRFPAGERVYEEGAVVEVRLV